MCLSSNLAFPLEQRLNLPPLAASFIRCTPLSESALEEVNYAPVNLPFENSPLIEAQVFSARLLAIGEDIKTVVELVLDITNEGGWSYLPGDTVGIMPENPQREVDGLLDRLGLPSGGDVSLELGVDLESKGAKKKLPSHLPVRASPRLLFSRCLDLRAIVKKSLLRSLMEVTPDEGERRRLAELCSREGSLEYSAHILNTRCTLLEVLEMFPSCRPPLSLLLEHLPRLQPRPYSIASSPLVDPKRIRIVFNVAFDGRQRQGVCSGWLYHLARKYFDLSTRLSSLELNGGSSPGIVRLYLRKPTQFRIPADPSLPLIMIGPGTGVAPFLGMYVCTMCRLPYLEERQYLQNPKNEIKGFLEHRRKQLENMDPTPINEQKNWLLFGCRYPVKDEIYKDVFVAYVKEKLCKYLVSHSRAESESSAHKYVQDILTCCEEEIIGQLLTTDSHLFICGDGQTMGRQISQCLTQCIARVRGIPDDEAKEIVAVLEKEGRILKDIWV